MTMLALAFLLLAGPQEGAPQAIDLVLRPPAQPLRFFAIQEIDTQLKAAGVEFKMEIDLELELVLRAGGTADDGLNRFDLLFERVRGVISAPFGGRTEFDSQDGKSEYLGLFNPKVLQLKMLAGRTIQAFVSAHGRVERIQGYAEIYAGTPIENELKAGGELLTDESFLNDVQFCFALLPERPVGPGEHWELSYPFSVFEDRVTLLPRFELGETSEDTARWSFVTLLEEAEPAQPDAPVDATSLSDYVAEVDVREASLQGESVVSRADGLPLRHNLEVVLDLQMPSPVGGPAVPAVVTQRVEVRRVGAAGGPPETGGAAPR